MSHLCNTQLVRLKAKMRLEATLSNSSCLLSIHRAPFCVLVSPRSWLLVHHSYSCPVTIRLPYSARNVLSRRSAVYESMVGRNLAEAYHEDQHGNHHEYTKEEKRVAILTVPAKWPTPFAFLVVTTLPSFVYHLFTTHFCASLVTGSQESE